MYKTNYEKSGKYLQRIDSLQVILIRREDLGFVPPLPIQTFVVEKTIIRVIGGGVHKVGDRVTNCFVFELSKEQKYNTNMQAVRRFFSGLFNLPPEDVTADLCDRVVADKVRGKGTLIECEDTECIRSYSNQEANELLGEEERVLFSAKA